MTDNASHIHTGLESDAKWCFICAGLSLSGNSEQEKQKLEAMYGIPKQTLLSQKEKIV